MSMLAEPKKKFKIGLNPRGTLWTNDENKFGQKLLEKMGWSKGKGLGKEEQGCHEPIRVSANSENKGVGFTGNSEDYSHHYQSFEDVLAKLNSENNTDNSLEQNISSSESILKNVESLEEKSKNLKSRLHYKKFTKSKDLSRYNEDDLACVLGSKRVKKDKNEGTPQEQNDSALEETGAQIGEMDQSHGMTTIFGGNLKDYFTQKMTELKRKREEGLLGDGTVQTPNQAKRLRLDSVPGTPFRDLEFEPERTEFSFNISTQEPELEEEIECQIASPELKTKKKKKKKLKEDDLEDNKKLKKKKKKDKKEKCEESDKENQILQEEMGNKSKKVNEDMNGISGGEPNGNAEKIKKKKKKKKHNIEDEYVIQEHQDIEENSIVIEGEVTLKEKKKKKKDKKTREEEKESNCENNDTLISGDQSEVPLKEKKKKKNKKIKHQEEMYNCENADTVNSVDQQPLSTEYDESEVSLKKKRKRKKDRKTDLEEEITTKTFNCENNDSQMSDYKQPLCTEMNESYVKATSKEDQKKNEDDRDENESHKPLRKLKKLASEISLTGILKNVSEKSGTQRNNVLVADVPTCDSELVDEEERKPKVKLTSKRSFKEFKNDLEEKIRKRVKKRDKKDMETIEEEEKTVEKLAGDQEEMETTTSTIVQVTVPVRRNDSNFCSRIKLIKVMDIDVEKLFPGTNLLSVAGYRKAI